MDGMVGDPDLERLFAHTASFIDAGRFGAARPLLAAVGRLSPPSARLAGLTGVLALKQGRLTEALDGLDQALARWPDDAALRKYRADARRQSGDADGAARDAAEAVVLDPDDPEAKAILGVVLLGLGHCVEAAACLTEAVAARPLNPLFRLALSDSLVCRHDDDGAAATLAEGILLVPADVSLRDAAVLLAVLRRRFNEALDLVEAALAAGTVDAYLLGLKGHALSSLGRDEEAANAYAEARRLGPDDPYVRHLAAAPRALGDDANHGERAPAEYVRTLFDGYAPRFESHLISLGYRIPGLMRAALLRHGGAGLGPVLDLGCGTGLIAIALRDVEHGPITGIDLSPKMLAAAATKGLYAELRRDDVVHALETEPTAWAVMLAADVLCYFGALDALMTAARARLAPNGLFLFSVETSVEAMAAPRGWHLNRLGRYAHAPDYVRRIAGAAGFKVCEMAPEVQRFEAGAEVPGLLVVLSAP